MAIIDRKYHNLLAYILATGYTYEDPNRSGVKRKEVTHYNLEYHLDQGFPAITTKKLFWKAIVTELLWFLRGDTNTKYLNDHGISIWNKDAYNYYLHNGPIYNWDVTPFDLFKGGEIGYAYGYQWRKFGKNPWNNTKGIDQIQNLINNMINNPMSTRHIVTAWNPKEIGKNYVALPPCHWAFEIICFPDKNSYGFNLKWHQRSVDTFLGLPFNIASYALLAHIIGYITGYKPYMIIGDLSNVHIYNDHLSAVNKQLDNRVDMHEAPTLEMNLPEYNGNFDDFIYNISPSDIKLKKYKSYGIIQAEMIAMNNKK